MHKYFFPLADTYLTNVSGLSSKNFGLTEILRVGAIPAYASVTTPTTSETYNNQYFDNINLSSFIGVISGSFIGYADYFSGSVSGSSSSVDTSYFSGSLNDIDTIFSGSIVSSSLVGVISGSVVTYDMSSYYQGQANNLNGCFSGNLTGVQQLNIPTTSIKTTLTSYRSLINFDLSDINEEILNNNISTPQFLLNLRTCDAHELPLSYNVYAFAVSQSWDMGDGYFSDGGSSNGASWIYRNGVGNSPWVSTSSSIHTTMSLNDSASADGGGTWYPYTVCSQSFNYTTSDIRMDITPIVSQWLSGSIPNNGIILIASIEIDDQESGFLLDFFSENTNTIYPPYLDLGWDNFTDSFVTGSMNTGSINIQYITASISGITDSSSYFISPPIISGTFSGSAGLNTTIQIDPTILSASGIVFGTGLGGNIINLPFIGSISGVLSSASFGITGSCGNIFNAQLITASFIDGIWAGLMFTAYYIDNMVENAIISGSFPNIWISNCNFSVLNLPYDITTASYYTATLNSNYIMGDLIGKMTFNTTSSASFDGFFTDGIFNGDEVSLSIKGNIYTSSFSYTSSIDYINNSLPLLDTDQPFSVNVRDLNYSYQRGNIIDIFISPREKYPNKTFIRGFQFEQYETSSYLPTSSYYGIRDNITNEMIIDFDEYTQLNCNYPAGNYFELDTACLFPEREYQILVKIVDSNHSYTIDTGKKFKIVR